jgi:hypothetical protein
MATQAQIQPPQENARKDIKATKLALRAVLAYTEAMFRHRNTLEQRVYDKALDTSRKILKKVVEEPETRLATASYILSESVTNRFSHQSFSWRVVHCMERTCALLP